MASLATERRGGLVNLLIARRRVGGANLDVGAGALEPKVLGGGTVLQDARLILGVAGIRYTLDTRALV